MSIYGGQGRTAGAGHPAWPWLVIAGLFAVSGILQLIALVVKATGQ